MRYQRRGNFKSLRRSYRLFQPIILVCVTLILTFLSVSRTSNANENHKTAGIDTGAKYRTVKIGVLAKRGVEKCQERWGPTADYLTENIPGYSFTIVPLTYDEVYPCVERGEVDFILANSSFYVELENYYGSSRIATLKNLQAGKVFTVFGGVIFYRADRNDIKCLDDLRCKSFMAVEEGSFGGWRAVWKELKEHEIDPYQEFASLSFGGTHDAVVYAVRDGEVDAGSVRTGTLEQMALEGKIRLEDFQVIAHDHIHKHACYFPFFHSTDTYPEWPFARVKHTSDILAEKVTAALLEMSPDSPTAKTARCAGWTIPLNYQPVHDCLKELRVGPYKGYGKVTAEDVVREFWLWIAGIIVLVSIVIIILAYVHKLNRRLSETLTMSQDEIIKRKHAERALKESQRYTRELIETSLDPLVMISAEGKITDVNLATEDITGYPREKLIGTDFSDYFTDPKKATQGL
ncbi:MAG: PhnD/SsuA/transferrin family substrate-binding protein [candidate division Zixibacteria bacterium]|nr:PhnD/SsuA/transferrin family substrate-binding protein [candidate division Zixibacteria bacterium]